MPTNKNGKICYLELPATNVEESAAFYSGAFGWRMRKRGDGRHAFDDTTGEVSGAFVTGRNASSSPGMLLYIMVDDIDAACSAVGANGGRIIQPVGVDAPELTARFADPAGNIIGLYQEPKQ